MKLLDLGRHRKARIWLDELPIWYEPDRKIEQVVPAESEVRHKKQVAAIELFVPLGGRFLYGLLGGQFEADGSDHLGIDIGIVDREQPTFAPSLAGDLDDVRIGLPLMYGEAVRKAIGDTRQRLHLPAGHLSLNCAAHGVVGSSPVLFKHLGMALLRLLELEKPCSDGQLVAIFPEQYD